MKLGSQEINPIGIIRYVSIVGETTVTMKPEDIRDRRELRKINRFLVAPFLSLEGIFNRAGQSPYAN